MAKVLSFPTKKENNKEKSLQVALKEYQIRTGIRFFDSLENREELSKIRNRSLQKETLRIRSELLTEIK